MVGGVCEADAKPDRSIALQIRVDEQTYPELAQAAKCIRERLEMYEKIGNREWLVDIANFLQVKGR